MKLKISKKITVSVFIAILVLAVGVIYFFQNYAISFDDNSQNKLSSVNVIPVENVAFNPSQYQGTIGISGTVNKIVNDGELLLGCQDACVFMPVIFKGEAPKPKDNIVVYGQLSQQNGKYIFNAESIKPANQNGK